LISNGLDYFISTGRRIDIGVRSFQEHGTQYHSQSRVLGSKL
jgi:hypothetical protein